MEIVSAFFTVLNTIKLYHWNTKSYSRHKASDEFVEKITTLSDKFIETFIGKEYQKSYMYLLTSNSISLEIKTLNDDSVIQFLNEFSAFLINTVPKYLTSNDTDLINIRDEMLAEIRQTLYLYQLK
jgi:hypothetical protein